MLKFNSIPLSDPRLAPSTKTKFLNVSQLFWWELADSSGTHTGLVVVGEKRHQQGFQLVADVTVDIPPGDGIPMEKVRELCQTVEAELIRRAVIQQK